MSSSNPPCRLDIGRQHRAVEKPFRSDRTEELDDITWDESSSTITSLPPRCLSLPEGIARGYFDDVFVFFASSPIQPRFELWSSDESPTPVNFLCNSHVFVTVNDDWLGRNDPRRNIAEWELPEVPPQCRDQKASDCLIGRGCWPIPWLLLFLQLRSHKSQWGHFVDANNWSSGWQDLSRQTLFMICYLSFL